MYFPTAFDEISSSITALLHVYISNRSPFNFILLSTQSLSYVVRHTGLLRDTATVGSHPT